MYLYLYLGLALSKQHISYSLKLHGGDIIVQLENHACYNWRSHVIVQTRLAKRISKATYCNPGCILAICVRTYVSIMLRNVNLLCLGMYKLCIEIYYRLTCCKINE